jgi:hypothetical protein
MAMTPEQRNAAICKDYVNGMTVYELEQKYQFTRQWIHKILTAGGIVLRPKSEAPRVNRDTFLGANIGEQTKKDAENLAAQKGTSVSAITDQALQEFIEKEKTVE